MIKTTTDTNSLIKDQEEMEYHEEENNGPSQSRGAKSHMHRRTRKRSNERQGGVAASNRENSSDIGSAQCCCCEKNQRSTSCTWKAKHDSLEKLFFDMEEEWSLKEEKAFELIAELRSALQKVVNENDDLMNDIQTLINSCESLSKSNKKLRRENRSLKSDHEDVTDTIRHLMKEVETKESVWKSEWLEQKQILKNEGRGLQKELKATKLELKESKSKLSILENDYMKQRERVLILENEHSHRSLVAPEEAAEGTYQTRKNVDALSASSRRRSSQLTTEGRQKTHTRSEASTELERYRPNYINGPFQHKRSSAISNATTDSSVTVETESASKVSASVSFASVPSVSNNGRKSSAAKQAQTTMISPQSVAHSTQEGNHLHDPPATLTKSLKRLLQRHNGTGRRSMGSANASFAQSIGTHKSEASSRLSGSAAAAASKDEFTGDETEDESAADQDETMNNVKKSILDVSLHTEAAKARRERMDLQKLLQEASDFESEGDEYSDEIYLMGDSMADIQEPPEPSRERRKGTTRATGRSNKGKLSSSTTVRATMEELVKKGREPTKGSARAA